MTIETASAGAESTGTPAADLFPDLSGWVHGWLLPFYRRRVEDGRHRAWCPQWWRHAEAVIRLTAVWRVFEDALRSGDPAAMSVFLRDHLDYHLTVLTDPDGPLKGCNTVDGHNAASALQAWPIADAPDGFAEHTKTETYLAVVESPDRLEHPISDES